MLPGGVPTDRPPDELLRRPRLVDVRGVPERDPQLHRLAEERLRSLLVQRPRVQPDRRIAITHATQRDTAHFEIGAPQARIQHDSDATADTRLATALECR